VAAIELLFVDADIVVANKPSGLSVHRGWDNERDVALFRVRDAVGQHVHAVHRLDKGTSGALLFARSPAVAATLTKAFETGQVEKHYVALVRGKPPDDGVVDYPLPKTEGGPRVTAVTFFSTIARSSVDRCSLVLARPQTGRQHQVRLHLRHINHPLVGDVNHGSGAINRHYRATYDLHRLALHAASLTFDHPTCPSRRVQISAPLPGDLLRPFAALGLPTEGWGTERVIP
jgi:tRNA pseudouridine65 synthase